MGKSPPSRRQTRAWRTPSRTRQLADAVRVGAIGQWSTRRRAMSQAASAKCYMLHFRTKADVWPAGGVGEADQDARVVVSSMAEPFEPEHEVGR